MTCATRLVRCPSLSLPAHTLAIGINVNGHLRPFDKENHCKDFNHWYSSLFKCDPNNQEPGVRPRRKEDRFVRPTRASGKIQPVLATRSTKSGMPVCSVSFATARPMFFCFDFRGVTTWAVCVVLQTSFVTPLFRPRTSASRQLQHSGSIKKASLAETVEMSGQHREIWCCNRKTLSHHADVIKLLSTNSAWMLARCP